MNQHQMTQLNLNHDLCGAGGLIDARFYELVRSLGCTELRDLNWSDDPTRRDAAVDALGAGLVFRNASYTRLVVEEQHAVAVVGFTATSPRVDVSAAGVNQRAIRRIRARIEAAFPPITPGPAEVEVEFWAAPGRGPLWRRQLEMVAWKDVRENYHPHTADELSPLFASPSFDSGKLVLWHGEPGTGKTHALRAFMAQHARAAVFHYVTDPEHFFGDGGDYMLRLLLNGAEASEQWKVVILEDAGELLAFDARERVGQALSRLLNACDGLVGQGLRLLVLITTNEDVGKMHPAVTRPGRCLSKVEFRRFDPEAATMWLKGRGVDSSTLVGSRTVAQLFAEVNGNGVDDDPLPRFGF